jgi:outer membrane lipoprotein carrier protein
MTASAIAKRMALGFASVWLLSFVLAGQTVNLDTTLKGIENRYNKTQSLELGFSETYTLRGHKRTESGKLFLRKPGRMLWQYTAPPGKLFVSDGQYFYYYSPEDNRAEKMKMKEADDLRAPLAFLLGRLNFKEDFGQFRSMPQGQDALITAIPKSDKLPYTEVSFLSSPDFEIKHLQVRGQDGSLLEFAFDGEKKNPALPEGMFKFTPPAGADYVDSSK